jgi:hypothetical protein
VQRAGIRGVQQRFDFRLLGGAMRQQLRHAVPQRSTRLRAEREEHVERGAGGSLGRLRCLAGKEAARDCCLKIENLIADRDAAPRVA